MKKLKIIGLAICVVSVIAVLVSLSRKTEQSQENNASVALAENVSDTSGVFEDATTIDNRQMQEASKLKAEQNKKFEEYLDLMANFPKDDLHIPNQPYGLDDAIVAVKNWRDKVSGYVESKCMAEISTTGGASGQNGLKADCEAKIYSENIEFLNKRIADFRAFASNIEDLIKKGVINENTTY